MYVEGSVAAGGWVAAGAPPHAEYAEILKISYWAEESSLAFVYHEAIRVSELLPWDENLGEFMELIRRASQLTD